MEISTTQNMEIFVYTREKENRPTRDRDISLGSQERDISIHAHYRENFADTHCDKENLSNTLCRNIPVDVTDKDVSSNNPDREIYSTTHNKDQSFDYSTNNSNNAIMC